MADAPTIPLMTMVHILGAEVVRIRTVQAALVESAHLAEPDPGQMRKVEIYEAIIRFLEACDSEKERVWKVIQGRYSPGARDR